MRFPARLIADRAAIVLRGGGYGALWGAAFGGAPWVVVAIVLWDPSPLVITLLGSVVGSFVGTCLGCLGGVVLCTGTRLAARRPVLMRLVTGAVVAALPATLALTAELPASIRAAYAAIAALAGLSAAGLAVASCRARGRVNLPSAWHWDGGASLRRRGMPTGHTDV
jgi:hypothetical protein